MILGLEAPPAIQAELLAVAVMVGTRYCARDLPEQLFREEMQMLKVVSRVESADRSWYEEMGERLLDATSLDESGLAGGGTDTAAAP